MSIKRTISALILVVIIFSVSVVRADVSSGFFNNVTENIVGSGTYDLEFRFYYMTPDFHEEYIDWLSLTFPSGVTVNSATNIHNSEWEGQTGDGITTKWGKNYQVKDPIDVTFSVNITVAENFQGHVNIDWWIQGMGDIWGWNQILPPHEKGGQIVILNYTPGAPGFPSAPYPSIEEPSPVSTDLAWKNGADTETIKVFFGTSNPPTNEIYSGEAIETLSNEQIGLALSPRQRYYWQVHASNSYGTSVSKTWSFTTGFPEGEYSVGPSVETDYSSLFAAFKDLEDYGVIGPVIFRVGAGKHVGSYILNPVRGASETNTVTITSDDYANPAEFTRTDNTYTDRSVFRLVGVKHFRFKDISFKLDRTAPWGIHMLKGCEDIQIINNSFHVLEGEVSIIASANLVTSGQAGNNVSNLLVEGNTIKGGSIGIIIYGPSAAPFAKDIIVRNNKITDTTWDAIRFIGLDAYVLSNNVIDMAFDSTNESRGIFIDETTGAFLLTGNKVTNAKQYGLYYGSHRSTDKQAIIANNMIGGGFQNSGNWTAAIHVHGSMHNVGFYYNSLLVDVESNSTSSAIYFWGNGSSLLDFVNNSFVSKKSSTGFAFYGWPNTINRMDYNNFYNTGTRFVWYGELVSLIKDLQEIDGKNMNSRAGDPQYISGTDLHSNGIQLWMSGTPIEGIDYDIDGDLRDSVHPCIGADEYKPILNSDLAAVALTGPETLEVGESHDFEISVMNTGTLYQVGYTVALVTDSGIELCSTSIYEPIWPQQTVSHYIQWTPTEAGNYAVRGKVISMDDENPYNNETEVITVHVEPSTSVKDDITAFETALHHNYPNPFNPVTTIAYSLEEDTDSFELNIYNVRGQLVRTLMPKSAQRQGKHTAVWDGTTNSGEPATSGIYFYEMRTTTYRQRNKMMLLK